MGDKKIWQHTELRLHRYWSMAPTEASSAKHFFNSIGPTNTLHVEESLIVIVHKTTVVAPLLVGDLNPWYLKI